jgi:hypothetical protein
MVNERLHLLRLDIETELAAIEHIFAALHQSDTALDDSRNAIVVGYYLHNLYNAFENLFHLVAEAFENHVPDPSRWHTLLLDRMGRDIEEIRPRLVGETALKALDELRRFRHVFRHVYRYDLDAEKVERVLAKAYLLETVYRDDIGQFLTFLRRLEESRLDGRKPHGE